jgi:hypothetical protein
VFRVRSGDLGGTGCARPGDLHAMILETLEATATVLGASS